MYKAPRTFKRGKEALGFLDLSGAGMGGHPEGLRPQRGTPYLLLVPPIGQTHRGQGAHVMLFTEGAEQGRGMCD